jgi:hypothetical protein
MEPEKVLIAEVEIVAGLWDVGTAVAAALRPAAMIGGPVLRGILLECIMSLPAARF